MKQGLLIDPKDNVGIIIDEVVCGEKVAIGNLVIEAVSDIVMPHKIALQDIPIGAHVIKFGEIIGYATKDIRCGEFVHVHNLDSEKLMK